MAIQWKEIQHNHSDSSGTNVWFGVSLVLLGLIVGFMAPWILGATG